MVGSGGGFFPSFPRAVKHGGGKTEGRQLSLVRPALVIGGGAVVAWFCGYEWERVAFGAVLAGLVWAMLQTMPLADWLYPHDDEGHGAK
jgi:hypothetical protein